MNVQLLRRFQRKALKYPESIEMADWISEADKTPKHPCGAVACIAGHIALMTHPRLTRRYMLKGWVGTNPGQRPWNIAQRELRLDEEQTDRLFLVAYWPARFANRYDNAWSYRVAAQAVVDRIDHFIKTKGAK